MVAFREDDVNRPDRLSLMLSLQASIAGLADAGNPTIRSRKIRRLPSQLESDPPSVFL
jgi:hypothetical protein